MTDQLVTKLDALIERQWQRNDPPTVPAGQAIDDQWLHYGRHHSKSEGVL